MPTSDSQEIDDLQRQMHRVRTSLGVEVHDLVENARAMTDWRRYWRSHPWAWCGAAAILGYVVVPHRRAGPVDAHALAEVARAELNKASPATAPPARRRGLVADLAGMALGFAAKRGLQILGQRLEGMLKSQTTSPPPPFVGPERARKDYEKSP